MMSLTPSVVSVRKALTTEKYISSVLGMCDFASSGKDSRSKRSASAPLTGGRANACHVPAQQPARYGESRDFKTSPSARLKAFSSPVAKVAAVRASVSNAMMRVSSWRASDGTSLPWTSLRCACSLTTRRSSAWRSFHGKGNKELPLSTKRSRTRTDLSEPRSSDAVHPFATSGPSLAADFLQCRTNTTSSMHVRTPSKCPLRANVASPTSAGSCSMFFPKTMIAPSSLTCTWAWSPRVRHSAKAGPPHSRRLASAAPTSSVASLARIGTMGAWPTSQPGAQAATSASPRWPRAKAATSRSMRAPSCEYACKTLSSASTSASGLTTPAGVGASPPEGGGSAAA
mmetsp:Transcript_81559/g.249144  ORF Transcript_81559/g.249144 Transcript_81559/m.249144 type:complete len:343 (+) Transcript_81559:371-1399(+)